MKKLGQKIEEYIFPSKSSNDCSSLYTSVSVYNATFVCGATSNIKKCFLKEAFLIPVKVTYFSMGNLQEV
jgi:hypothetical protein